jgi:hypothetical protein
MFKCCRAKINQANFSIHQQTLNFTARSLQVGEEGKEIFVELAEADIVQAETKLTFDGRHGTNRYSLLTNSIFSGLRSV